MALVNISSGRKYYYSVLHHERLIGIRKSVKPKVSVAA
jgi:hypothetical protein